VAPQQYWPSAVVASVFLWGAQQVAARQASGHRLGWAFNKDNKLEAIQIFVSPLFAQRFKRSEGRSKLGEWATLQDDAGRQQEIE